MQRILLILTLFTLAACGMLNPTGSSTTGGAAPILQITQSPADVVRAFLDNWNGKNRQGMYDLLSGTSRGMITFAVFDTVYNGAETTLSAEGVTYTIKNTIEQGNTAAVNYDASIRSTLFGEILDNNRTMRLVRDGNNWRIAWTQIPDFDRRVS